jgi:hypothetical protein
MHKLISKSTGLMAIFAALVMTPVMSQSAIAQDAPTQAAMSDCNKNASQTTGESLEDEEISHNGQIHRRKKDQNAAIVPSQEVEGEQLVSHNGRKHRSSNNNA